MDIQHAENGCVMGDLQTIIMLKCKIGNFQSRTKKEYVYFSCTTALLYSLFKYTRR